jgi:FG-GAP repeat protein
VDGDIAGVNSIAAADVDGDGDLDVLGAATQNPLLDIAWWSNRGGQFALPTADTAPPSIANGQIADVLRIDARHRGRARTTSPRTPTWSSRRSSCGSKRRLAIR